MNKWQYYIKVIPLSNLSNDFINHTYIISEIEYKNVILWCDFKLSNNWHNRISTRLVKKDRLAKNIIQYGELDRTCMVFWLVKEFISEIQIRLDVRQLNEDIVKLIVEFTNHHHGAIFTSDGKVISADINTVMKEIKSSEAYGYLNMNSI